jgi:hypothetical protein
MQWPENRIDFVHALKNTGLPVAGDHLLHRRHGIFDVRKSPVSYTRPSTTSFYLGNDSIAYVPKDFRCYIKRVLEHSLHFALNIDSGLNSSKIQLFPLAPLLCDSGCGDSDRI